MILRTALVTAANAIADALERSSESSSTWVDICDETQNPAGYRQAHAAGERGEIEIRKVGRRRLVRRTDLDSWIAARPKLGDIEPENRASSHVAALVNGAGWRRSA